jgi:CRP/FNR family cyclic AMP-dependent transcriptional regulator
MHLPRVTEFLGYVPLFQRLTPDERRGFAALVREQRYPRGALIVRQGDPGDALYVVRSGAVKVAVVGQDGREVILGTLGQGDHFGELALIDGQPRSAHVVAMEPTVLLVLRRDEFRRQVEQMPRVAWALLEELSRRLRDADAKITGLVLLDVPGRVARLVLDRAEGDRLGWSAPDARGDRPDDRREPRDRVARDEGAAGRGARARRAAAHHRARRRGLARRAAPGAGARAARAERAERAADAEAALLLDDEDAPAGADDATRGGALRDDRARPTSTAGMEPAASEADGDAARAPAR